VGEGHGRQTQNLVDNSPANSHFFQIGISQAGENRDRQNFQVGIGVAGGLHGSVQHPAAAACMHGEHADF
jgi:hypothetical protein